MIDHFSITVNEWLTGSGVVSPEQMTMAELSIHVNGNCVTQVEDLGAKTVRSAVRVSAEPLAKWLLANWWRLRWETADAIGTQTFDWKMAHSLSAIGNGYVWPDVVFKGSDGDRIALECKASFLPDNISPIRFLDSFEESVASSHFEAGVRSFVEQVRARLHEVGIRSSELNDLWNDLSLEWRNPKYTSHRRLEALLGVEPDANDPLIQSVTKWGNQFGHDAAAEIAAASGSNETLKVLDDSKKVMKSVRTFADLSGVRETSAPSVSGVPWQTAQTLAYDLRTKWDLGSTAVSDDDLADRLSLNVTQLRESRTDSPISFGLRGVSDNKLGLVLNRKHDHGRRFDTARLIGDYLVFDGGEKVKPATSSTTFRMKFQRAFAAEFLCPSERVRERFPQGIDRGHLGRAVEELSTEYNVGHQVILNHMQNRKLISKELAESPLLLA